MDKAKIFQRLSEIKWKDKAKVRALKNIPIIIAQTGRENPAKEKKKINKRVKDIKRKSMCVQYSFPLL